VVRIRPVPPKMSYKNFKVGDRVRWKGIQPGYIPNEGVVVAILPVRVRWNGETGASAARRSDIELIRTGLDVMLDLLP